MLLQPPSTAPLRAPDPQRLKPGPCHPTAGPPFTARHPASSARLCLKPRPCYPLLSPWPVASQRRAILRPCFRGPSFTPITMTLKTSPGIAPTRVTASNTIERLSAPLDARSLVALEFAAFWAHKYAAVRVPAAVLIRRALSVYADHISGIEGPCIAGEIHRVREAGKGIGSALTLTEARARIEDHRRAPAAQPMSHWQDALISASERREGRAMLDRLEAFMAAQFRDDEEAAV